MRAGPLSHKDIVDLLNSYFVPVYAVNEDYREKGSKPPEERAEYTRIYRQALDKKLSAGSVHVYICSPEGEVVDSAHVAEAAKPVVLKELLERNIERFSLKPQHALIAAKPQAPAPPCEDGALALHLVARSLDGKGAWSEIPPEEWIVLNPPDAGKLLPDNFELVGQTWPIPQRIAEKLFTHFYPATENNDVQKNKFEHSALKGTLEQLDSKNARIRLEGDFVMEHSFYHKPDANRVAANVVGYVDANPSDNTISAFRMVTDSATYNGGKFGVALRKE
jgi:hypothetical protein